MGLFRRDTVADLTRCRQATFRLLSDADWKKRAVEEISIGSALSMQSRRSFQCADIGAVIEPLRPRWAQHARLLLPVTTLPKRPLLGFDVSAPDRTVAHLPPRAVLASVEAAYVVELADAVGVAADAGLQAMLTSICEFSPGRWERWRRDDDLPHRVKSYVEATTGWCLDQQLVRAWLETQEPVARVLADAVGEDVDPASSSENPAVVVPLLRETLGIRPDEVLPLLTRYARFVDECARRGGPLPFAAHEALADYGRWWEVMIECTVPLDGPFIVRMSERRPLTVASSGRAHIDVTTGDAVSNHTVVRLTDASVEFRSDDHDALGADGSAEDVEFDSVRFTREEIATYASTPDRDYRVTLRLELGLSGHAGLVNAVVCAVTVLSIALILVQWATLDDDDLAVLVIPTTFAVSLLVTRERTTLAARLATRWRLALLALMVILWSLVGLWYVSDTCASRAAQSPELVTPPVFDAEQHSANIR